MTAPRLTEAQAAALGWLPADGSDKLLAPKKRGTWTPSRKTMESLVAKGYALPGSGANTFRRVLRADAWKPKAPGRKKRSGGAVQLDLGV